MDNPYNEVFTAIDALLRNKRRVVVALDGMSGSGKSSLARLLCAAYGAETVHMDDFFLPPELRTDQRLEEVGGNIDYERFARQVIQPLLRAESISYPVFDCAALAFGETRRLMADGVVVVEGVYSMREEFRSAYDLTVFLGVSADEQARRVLQRSGPELFERFRDAWIPMENRYFHALRVRERCDIALDTTGFSTVR